VPAPTSLPLESRAAARRRPLLPRRGDSMMQSLLAICAAFCRLAVMRLRPQDLPRSGALLGIALATNVAMSAAIGALVGLPMANAVLELVVLLGLTSALLYASARARRIAQTLTALLGAGAVLGVAVFLLLALAPGLPPVLHVGIFFWNMFVIGHILRHALDIPFVLGCVLAFVYALTLKGLLKLFVA